MHSLIINQSINQSINTPDGQSIVEGGSDGSGTVVATNDWCLPLAFDMTYYSILESAYSTVLYCTKTAFVCSVLFCSVLFLRKKRGNEYNHHPTGLYYTMLCYATLTTTRRTDRPAGTGWSMRFGKPYW